MAAPSSQQPLQYGQYPPQGDIPPQQYQQPPPPYPPQKKDKTELIIFIILLLVCFPVGIIYLILKKDEIFD
ncbi:MAG: hypothetical protein QMC80_07235 [Thermoplasmatales archaeon]|nr:hypothetical protein [Thermoplasmatales archaeon]